MVRIALLLLLDLLPSAIGGPARASAATPRCADFLGQMRIKPAHVAFTGCRFLPDRQGKPLRATYRVDGRHAARAEAELVKTVGLARLRRTCCQWDAPEREFIGSGGRTFSLTMVSEETIVLSRADWSSIGRFEITVITFTEDI